MNQPASLSFNASRPNPIQTPAIVGQKRPLVSVGSIGDPGVVVAAPVSMGLMPGAIVVVTKKGHVECTPDDIEVRVGRQSPYDTFDEAEDARLAGQFSLLPQKPEHVIADLIAQLEGIGIEEWNGAEGLSLEAARAFMESSALEVIRADRAYQAKLTEVSWNESDWTYADWQQDVANGDTRRSYAQWVLANREQTIDDEEFVSAMLMGIPPISEPAKA